MFFLTYSCELLPKKAEKKCERKHISSYNVYDYDEIHPIIAKIAKNLDTIDLSTNPMGFNSEETIKILNSEDGNILGKIHGDVEVTSDLLIFLNRPECKEYFPGDLKIILQPADNSNKFPTLVFLKVPNKNMPRITEYDIEYVKKHDEYLKDKGLPVEKDDDFLITNRLYLILTDIGLDKFNAMSKSSQFIVLMYGDEIILNAMVQSEISYGEPICISGDDPKFDKEMYCKLKASVPKRK